MARKFFTDIDLQSTSKVINVPTPTAAGDAVPKSYVDSAVEGLAWKDSARVGTQSNINLSSPGATIDGVTLKQTEYEYTQTDEKGTVLRHSKGFEFISEDWRTFFSGHSDWELEDGTWAPSDTPPVKFITPGKPGFASTIPLFECDGQMSSLVLPHSVAKFLGGS